jgi:hypothetical protein
LRGSFGIFPLTIQAVNVFVPVGFYNSSLMETLNISELINVVSGFPIEETIPQTEKIDLNIGQRSAESINKSELITFVNT